MNEPTWLRRLAEALLSAALAIAPGDTLEWGQAMLGELRHVEGNWSAFFWSLGSAGVLAKHALVALIFPSGSRSTMPSGGDLFSKEAPMRKTALSVIASCVVASLLFFLAPVFRQAFRISLLQWHGVLHVRSHLGDAVGNDSMLETLARQAENNKDADALAFAALHSSNPAVSVRAVNEATRLDSKLTWIYALVYTGYPANAEANHWIGDLEKFDPQNALPHLMAAQKIGIRIVFSQEFPRGHAEENPGWRDEMAAAFRSLNLDTYFERKKQLDRRIIARYGIDDPFEVISDYRFHGLPSYSAWYCERFAKSELEAGEKLEAQGDRKGALEKYSAVAAFGQLMSERNYFVRNDVLRDALTHLGALSRKDGKPAQTEFYETLIQHVERQEEEQVSLLRAANWAPSVFRWNAVVARASGVAMLISALVLGACLIGVVVRSWSFRPASLRPSRSTLAIACTSAVVSLFSCAMLYVAYTPYSEIFRRFVAKGDEAGLSELSGFLAETLFPLGSGLNPYLGFYGVVFYFWFGVAVLCALALAFGVLRYLQTRPRATAA